MFNMRAIYFNTCASMFNQISKYSVQGKNIDGQSWVILLVNSSISAGLLKNTRFLKKDHRKKIK